MHELTYCPRCRARRAQLAAELAERADENGASITRRDRLQLGLNITPSTQ
ncbi:hypothetical protein [Streptomyces sp. SCSIO ZS0520]|nr:hypothetical protein [Streptomyces sp. SCSIO ZS0520]